MSQQYLALNVTQRAYNHFMPHHKQTAFQRSSPIYTKRGFTPKQYILILSALCLHEAGILNDQPHIFETEIQSGKVWKRQPVWLRVSDDVKV